jgi:single-strand DNA-binding protein
MNTIMISGNMAHNPEVRYTKTGKAVASFSVAVNRYNGQNDTADFIPVVAWERLGEACGNSLTKGQRVFVQGRLQIRSYEGNDGQKKWVSEIVAEVVSPNLEQAAIRPLPEGAGKLTGGSQQDTVAGHQDIADEIPF